MHALSTSVLFFASLWTIHNSSSFLFDSYVIITLFPLPPLFFLLPTSPFLQVLMPPTIKTQTKWLVITVHFAEYLPKLDSAGALGAMTGGTGGIDAYYVVQVEPKLERGTEGGPMESDK